MSQTAPTIIRAGSPREDTITDHGSHVQIRTLVDAAGGPSAGIVMGQARLDPACVEARHHHDIPEVVHVTSGGGTARLGDRSVPIEPGDTVFVPAGLVHGWEAGEEGLAFLYVFPADRSDAVTYHWAAA